jgi:D-glycero-D-manno-heptose 1,7-bisphosphate phosphatase
MTTEEKIKSRAQLAKICLDLKKMGKKVGFTSGSFDIIHAGHVSYLEKAKDMCDILIVAVNSDESVRKYKGSDRPIVPENERIRLIAGLCSVDYAFLFDERRNSTNIEELRPDYYIKAGDYKTDELSSKDLVEAYGGKIVLIPIDFNASSSGMIDKILKVFGHHDLGRAEVENAVHIPILQTKKNRAIFLDRDGTINEDIEYLHEPERFRFLPNALSGMKRMNELGFKLAVVTTQAGIGLGYFTKEDFYKVNREMFRQLAPAGVIIDKIYFCPHGKGDKCKCRKPETGLLEIAANDLNLDLPGSYMIGDKTSDIEAGRRMGCKTILIKTAKPDKEFDVKPDYVAVDLLDAANFILEQDRKL